MLTELDLQLINKEAHNTSLTWLKPLVNCDDLDIQSLFKDYNVAEFAIKFYDSDPLQCFNCTGDCYTKSCSIWKDYKNSKERLSYNNWTDVFGPGIWGETQKEINKRVETIFEEIIFEDEESKIRTFYYQPHDKRYFQIFYYNRDREYKDYWFIFKKK